MQPVLAPAGHAALRRAARDFEAHALAQLLQPVFATVDSARGAFGGGAAEAQWRPMLVDAYAAAAARSGGVGIAESVFRELLRTQSAIEGGTT
jgi:flagellar protein FlgJ